ncbi:MAG: arsenic resistance protein [Candidatus Nitrosopolaris sp.]
MNSSAMLFLAVTISMVIGVLLPQFSKIFAPYLLIWLGGLLFLNLIQLETSELVSTFDRAKDIVLLSLIKLVVLPLALYASTSVIYPPLALPVLLLSGISTGLGAPFVANFVGTKLTLIVGLIIVTSLAVPFVLPPIVHLLYGSHFSIPIIGMIVSLSAALLTPFLAGWFTKKFATNIAEFVSEKSLYLSIVLIALMNMAVFSKISIYFFDSPLFVIEMVLIAFLLFGVYGTAGYALTLVITSRTRSEETSITNISKSNTIEWRRTAAIEGLIAMAYVNNILVAVFAEQFFGIQTAVLPALYNIPYYIGIIILKKLYSVPAHHVKN